MNQNLDQNTPKLNLTEQKRLIDFFKNQQHPLKKLFENNRIDLRHVINTLLINMLKKDQQPFSTELLEKLEQEKPQDSIDSLNCLLGLLIDPLKTSEDSISITDGRVPIEISFSKNDDGGSVVQIELGGNRWGLVRINPPDSKNLEMQAPFLDASCAGLAAFSIAILNSDQPPFVHELLEETVRNTYYKVCTDDLDTFWALKIQGYDLKNNTIMKQVMSFSGYQSGDSGVMRWRAEKKDPLDSPIYSASFYSTQRQVWPAPKYVGPDLISWELGNKLCEIRLQGNLVLTEASKEATTISDWAQAAVLAQSGQWFNTERAPMPELHEVLLASVLDVLEKDGMVWLRLGGKHRLILSHTPYTQEIIEHCQMLVEMRALENKLNQPDPDRVISNAPPTHSKRRL